MKASAGQFSPSFSIAQALLDCRHSAFKSANPSPGGGFLRLLVSPRSFLLRVSSAASAWATSGSAAARSASQEACKGAAKRMVTNHSRSFQADLPPLCNAKIMLYMGQKIC